MDEFLELFANVSEVQTVDDPSNYFLCFDKKKFAEQSYAFRLMNNRLWVPPDAKVLESQLNQLEAAEKSCPDLEQKAINQSKFYVPCMAKPAFPKASNLNSLEMRDCFHLMCGWMKEQLNPENQAILANYMRRVEKERSEFQTFVSIVWRGKNFRRYLQMPPAPKAFIEHYWQKKINSVLPLYPNFYNKLTTVPLVYDDTENPIKMEFQRCLHTSGSLMELKIPFRKQKHVLKVGGTSLLTSSPDKNQPHYQQPVSLDGLAGHIAMNNDANFVLSSSSFKKLVDNFYPNFTNAWELPIVVKEFKIGKHNKRVIFIDKALPPTNLSTAEKSKWFTKKAVIPLLIQANRNQQKKEFNPASNNAEMTPTAASKDTESNVNSLDISVESENSITLNTPASSSAIEETSPEGNNSFSNQTQTTDSPEKLSEQESSSSPVPIENEVNTSKSSNLPVESMEVESCPDLVSPDERVETKVGNKPTRKTRQSKRVKILEFDTPGTKDDSFLSNKRVTRASGSPSDSQMQDLISEVSSCAVGNKKQSSSTSPVKKTITRRKTICVDPRFARKTRQSGAIAVAENKMECDKGPSPSNSKVENKCDKSQKRTPNSKKSLNDSSSPEVSGTKVVRATRNTRSSIRCESQAESAESSFQLISNWKSSACNLPKNSPSSEETVPKSNSKNSNVSATGGRQTRSKKNDVSVSPNTDKPSSRKTRGKPDQNLEPTPTSSDNQSAKAPGRKPNTNVKLKPTIDSDQDSDSDNLIIDFEEEDITGKDSEKSEVSMKSASPIESSAASSPLKRKVEPQNVVCNKQKANALLPQFNFYREVGDKSNASFDKTSPYSITSFPNSDVSISESRVRDKTSLNAANSISDISEDQPLDGFSFEEAKASIDRNASMTNNRQSDKFSPIKNNLTKKGENSNQSLDKFCFKEAEASMIKNNPVNNEENKQSFGKFSFEKAKASMDSSNSGNNVEENNQSFGKFSFEKAKASMDSSNSVNNSECNRQTLDKFSFENAKADLDANTSAKDNKQNEESTTSESSNSLALRERTNVSYTLWTLHKEDNSRILLKSGTRSLTLMIRTKNVGTIQEGNCQSTVNPTTKVEYNPEFGASCLTLTESVHTWADLFIKPYTNSLRVRVAHSDYEVMMTEKMKLTDAIMELKRLHNVTPQHCYNNLYSVLVKLADLDAGNYSLCHEPRDGAFAVLYKASETNFGSHNRQHSYQKTQAVSNERCPFIPIDSLIITPANHFQKRVPATFHPNKNNDRFSAKNKKKNFNKHYKNNQSVLVKRFWKNKNKNKKAMVKTEKAVKMENMMVKTEKAAVKMEKVVVKTEKFV